MNANDVHAINRVIGMIDFAKSITVEELTKRNSEPVYPVTIGEHIVSYTLNLILSHEWNDEEAEMLVDEMQSILSQLDTGVDRPDDWQALFVATDPVSNQLNNS